MEFDRLIPRGGAAPRLRRLPAVLGAPGLLALVLLLAPALAGAGVPLVDEILVLDSAGANGPTLHAVTMNDEIGNTLRTLAESAEFGSEMVAAVVGPQKLIYVASGSVMSPRIVAYDPYAIGGGAVVGTFTHPYLEQIADIVSDGEGGLYVLDRQADPLGEGWIGAIFHLDPATGAFTVVLSAPHFTDPASLVLEPGGTLLVLDPTGRLQPGGALRGAIYRVDPVEHSINALRGLDDVTMLPEQIALLDASTLLLVDSNLIVPGMGAAGGGVLKLATSTWAVLDTLALPAFGDPSDLIVDSEGNIVVMDPGAAVPGGRALFRLDPATGSLLGSRFENPNFRSLQAVVLVAGPELDESTFSYQKLNGFPPVNPGDRLRWTGALHNTGTAPTGEFTLRAQFGALVPLLGTQVVSSGTFGYDPVSNEVHWTGELAPDGRCDLAVDLRVPESGEIAGELGTQFVAAGDQVRMQKSATVVVVSATEGGDLIVADPGSPGSPTTATPRLFRRLNQDHTQRVYWDPILLPNPVDLAFGGDGLLYVLDGTTGRNRIVRLDPRTPASAAIIFEGGALQLASGICLAHDGALLIADPKVSLPGINVPGVIYRFDPVTRALTTFFSDPELIDPVDITQDTGGGYVVCDYRYSAGEQLRGRIFELDGEGRPVRAPIDALRHNRIHDPMCASVGSDNTIYIADARYGTNPDRGAIVSIARPDGPGTQGVVTEIVGESNSLLVNPHGIEVFDLDGDGDAKDILLCDRDPVLSGGKRAILQLLEEDGVYSNVTGWVIEDSLRRPHRVARRILPKVEVVSLETEGDVNGEVRPGDLLQVRLVFQNPARTPVLGVAGRISYPPALELRDFTYDDERGVMFDNRAVRALHWSGDLAYIHPVEIEAEFRVSATVPNREVITITFDVLGLDRPTSSTVSVRVRGPLGGGERIVLDALADPYETEEQRGALYLLDLEQETLEPYYADVADETAADMHLLSADELLVVEKTAEIFNGTGGVLKRNLRTGSRTVWAFSSNFRAPTRILPRPSGGFMILDELAELSLPPARGAIFQVEDSGSGLGIAAYSRAFRWPTDMTFDPQGRLWVADMAADPLGLGGDTGALFLLQRQASTGAYEVVDTVASRKLVSPQGLLWATGRGLFLTDPGWSNEQSETGIRLYNPNTDSITVIATHHQMITPRRIYALSGTRFLIVDQRAQGLHGERGVVFELDLSVSPPDLHAAATRWDTQALLSIAEAPGPEASVVFFGADEDARGRWTTRGDTLHCEIRVANFTGTIEPEAVLRVSSSEHLLLDPVGAQASAGSLAFDGGGVTWSGAVAGWDTVTIRYNALVQSTPGLSPYADQRAELTRSDGSAQAMRLLYYISTKLQQGEFVLVDKSVDPLGLGVVPGAVYRLQIAGSGYNRQLTPLFSSSMTITPVDVALVPADDERMLVVDANGPRGSQNRGGLFRADARTGSFTLVCQDPTFSEPRAVAIVDTTLCYLLDEGADPYNLLPGPQAPGAVYRIDLAAGTAQPVFSDTILASPVDILIQASTGRVIVLNRQGGASGGKAGRVISIDPQTGTYELIREGHPFEEPRAFSLGADGRMRIIDYKTGTSEGQLYALDFAGNYELLAAIEELRTPTGLCIDHTGRTYIADSNADPEGFGGSTGAVFQVAPMAAGGSPYLTGPPLADPRAMDSYYAETPVLLTDLALGETLEGVRLGWRAPAVLERADYYIYRRDAGESREAWRLLNPRGPVRGTGDLAYLDVTVLQGRTYDYLLVAALPDGGNLEFGPLSIEVRLPVSRLELERVRPDPVRFGASGTGLIIRYRVPASGGRVTLDLFDASGRRLHRLVDAPHDGGAHVRLWDGRDATGAPVSSGVYFLRLASRGHAQDRRFVLIR